MYYSYNNFCLHFSSLHSSFFSLDKEIKVEQSWCVCVCVSMVCILYNVYEGGLEHNIFLISIEPWLLITVYMHASYLLGWYIISGDQSLCA